MYNLESDKDLFVWFGEKFGFLEMYVLSQFAIPNMIPGFDTKNQMSWYVCIDIWY